MIERIGCGLQLFFLAIVFLCTSPVLSSVLAEEDPDAGTRGESSDGGTLRPQAETSAALQRESKGGIFSSGVFFGHIVFIDSGGRFLFIGPTNREFSRKYFYLDQKTRYTFVIEGRRKKRSFDDLIEGQRVAVRYFSRDRLAVADEVFVVFGEFEPGAYEKTMRRAPEEKSKKSDKKKKSGKKEKKKGGAGGH